MTCLHIQTFVRTEVEYLKNCKLHNDHFVGCTGIPVVRVAISFSNRVFDRIPIHHIVHRIESNELF